jgi:outer membrane protein insertion porin family/translocation and assembly module TamA
VDEDDRGPVVRRLRWHGVEAFDEDELEERILTTAQPWLRLRFWRPKRRLDEFDLEEDRERIAEAYREIGYFRTEVETRVLPAGDDRVEVEIEVDEGPRIELQDWTLEIVSPDGGGAEAPTRAEIERLRDQVAFVPGQPFGSKLYRERREALLYESAELGFPSARIRGGATVDPDTGTARVDWTLALGPRTYIGSVVISGLERIEEDIVQRDLAVASGDRFSPSAIEKSERRLIETGLFRSVAIGRAVGTEETATEAETETETETERESDSTDRMKLEVRVEEMPPRSLRASIGFGTQDGPRGELGLDWRNFFGGGRRFRARIFGSFLDAGVETSLAQPHLFGGRGRLDLSVTALRQLRPSYDAFVTGATGLLTLRAERDSPWSLVIGPGYELADITDFDLDVGRQLRGPRNSVIVNAFTLVRYDRVDRPIDPRRGVRVELGNELGGHPIGSDLDYHRWNLDLRSYQPIGPVVVATRFSATTLDPIGAGLSDVPLTRRLYAGGTNSVRGFDFQKLGPTDAGNEPIGGLSRMEMGIELRVPVWKRIGLVGFVDAGDVQLDTWTWRFDELRASAGPGLRIDTPVGPLRLDVGFLLNRPSFGDPWRIHLSVGQAF